MPLTKLPLTKLPLTKPAQEVSNGAVVGRGLISRTDIINGKPTGRQKLWLTRQAPPPRSQPKTYICIHTYIHTYICIYILYNTYIHTYIHMCAEFMKIPLFTTNNKPLRARRPKTKDELEIVQVPPRPSPSHPLSLSL